MKMSSVVQVYNTKIYLVTFQHRQTTCYQQCSDSV